MEYTPTLRNFGPAPTADEVSALLEKIMNEKNSPIL